MTRSFLLNIFLALIWMFLQGELRGVNFAVGLVLGYLIIAISERALGRRTYVRLVSRLLGFVGFVFWDIFSASIRLAWVILQPKPNFRPAVIAVPLDEISDVEIVGTANLISLSPGTLTIDMAPDENMLYVHTMFLDDMETFPQMIKDRYERRVVEVLR